MQSCPRNWATTTTQCNPERTVDQRHAEARIGLRCLDHHMKTIRHEDIGVNLPARLGASPAQPLNEALAIGIIHEDPFAPVSAIHDVINRTSILDSQRAGRGWGVASTASYINIKN